MWRVIIFNVPILILLSSISHLQYCIYFFSIRTPTPRPHCLTNNCTYCTVLHGHIRDNPSVKNIGPKQICPTCLTLSSPHIHPLPHAPKIPISLLYSIYFIYLFLFYILFYLISFDFLLYNHNLLDYAL